MTQEKIIDESLKRDLSSFPVFGAAFRRIWQWFKAELEARGGISGFYREYPAFLGQGILFLVIVIANEVADRQGLDLPGSVPSIFFFAFDMLNFKFLDEPYLLIFMFMTFVIAWLVNKLAIVSIPKLLSSNTLLFGTSVISGFLSFVIFGIVFSVLLSNIGN